MDELFHFGGSALGVVDFAVAGVALLGMLVIGWWCGRERRGGTDSFFLGGRHIPGWAACLSFVAAEISAMTIVGVPAESYRANWNYAQYFFGSAAARLVVAAVFIPVFFNLRVTTVYEFLGSRFGASTRYAATGFFFVMRLLASGVRLYIASLAVAAILGVPLVWTVLGFTILPIAFMAYGGMRAVIWTGVFQAILFTLGGAAVLVFLHVTLSDGLPGAFASAFPTGAEAAARATLATEPAAKAVYSAAAEGTALPYFVNATWNTGAYEPGSAAGIAHAIFSSGGLLWIGVLSGFFMSMASFGTDQENMQRMLCIETREQSARMLRWTIAAGGVILLIYLAVGSGLQAWYAANPSASLPAKTDQIFPHFIATVLPVGLKGLMLAAIVLASIDSPLVSLATSAVNDLYRPLRERATVEDTATVERGELRLSRQLVVLFGLILAGLALFFSRFDQILWVGFQIGAVTLSSLLGVFLYGLLTKAPAGRETVVAMLVNSTVMAVLLYLCVKKYLWLNANWLMIFGTLLTMGLIVMLRRVPKATTAPQAATNPAKSSPTSFAAAPHDP